MDAEGAYREWLRDRLCKCLLLPRPKRDLRRMKNLKRKRRRRKRGVVEGGESREASLHRPSWPSLLSSRFGEFATKGDDHIISQIAAIILQETDNRSM